MWCCSTTSKRPGTLATGALLVLVAAAPLATPERPPDVRPPPAPVVLAAATDPATPAPVEVRSALQMLLGEHVLLTVELMRQRVDGQGGSAATTLTAVEDNADALAAALGGVYGDEAREQFAAVWSLHVQQLAEYAAATGARDTEAQATARARLAQTERDLGELLATTVGLDRATVQGAVAEHYGLLLEQADQYAAQEYAAAYDSERTGFGHMIALGDVLATGVAHSQQHSTRELESPRRVLQSALSGLLGEHMGIMQQAMRATAAAAPDAAAAGEALNGNTADLGRAVTALYGRSASRDFLEVWAQHVEALMGFAAARGQGPQAEEAQRRLDEFASSAAAFFASATEDRLPAIELAAALTQHDEHLTEVLAARVAGDDPRAQAVAGAAYRHMFDLSQTLALAIGNTVAARLPVGGAATGGGGTVPAP